MKGHKPTSLPIRILRRLVKYTVRLLLTAIVLVAVILATIQTPPGKRLLAEVLSRVASTPGSTIRFRRISGILPFRVGLGELRLGDPEGDWLVVEDARVRIDFFELLRFQLHAESVIVERASWRRIPVAANDNAGEEGGVEVGDKKSFTPAEVPSFTVDRLLVRKVTVEESLFGRRVEAVLQGEVINSAAGPRAELVLHPPGKTGEGMVISASTAADLSRLEAELKLEEPTGGLLGGILFPGDPGPLSFHFRGEGPWAAVNTDFALQAPGRGEMAGRIVLDLGRALAGGDLNLAIEKPPFPVPGWAGKGDLSVRFAVEDGGQNLSARIQVRDLAGLGIEAKRVLVSAELIDLFRAPRGEAALEAEELSTPPSGEDDPGRGDLFRSVTGQLVLQNDGRIPQAELELRLQGYTIPGILLPPDQTRALALNGRLTEDRLEVGLKGEGEQGFRLQAELAAAARFSTGPFSLIFPEDGELEGSLSAMIDLSSLNNILALTRQTLGGIVKVELGVSGTIGSPIPKGELLLSGGEYQNLNTETVLHRIAVRLKIEEDRLVLEELSARTPPLVRPLLLSWTRFIPGIGLTPLADRDRKFSGAGRISLAGWTKLSPAEGFPSAYSLHLEDALLVNMDILTAIVSGEVDFSGSLEDSLLQGEVKIRYAEGRIPARMAASVPEIEVIEINKPGEETPRPPFRPSPFLEKMALDLKLTARRNIVVKGRGLDSEWEAKIAVTGTAAVPEIRGGLTLLSGIFIFMGEEMKLEDCSVMMDGGYPPVPQLKINARIVKPDITMNLQVVGPVTQPEVLISSQPPYPDDEILARLLFGRPASQISGLQALQIANGLRTLQGQAGFFDLLTNWASFLGNIQVDFTDLEGTVDQSAVRVRWSLSRKFYIENQRSMESPDNLFLARWEMSRNFQLRVQSGYGILGDAAYFHWRMDY